MSNVFENEKFETRVLIGYNHFLSASGLWAGNGFNISEFENFNKVVEAAVLYDKIVLFGEYSSVTNKLVEVLDRDNAIIKIPNVGIDNVLKNQQFLNIFLKGMHNVYGEEIELSEQTSPSMILERRLSPSKRDSAKYNDLVNSVIHYSGANCYNIEGLRLWCKTNIYDQKSNSPSFTYLTRGIIYSCLSEYLGIDFAPDYLRMPFAAMLFSQNRSPVTKQLYDALKSKVDSEIDSLFLLGMPLCIFVPPLTAEILQKRPTSENVGNYIIELRQKFTEFRKSYTEFSKLLRDDSATLSDKLSAKNKMYASVIGMMDSQNENSSMVIKTIFDKIIGIHSEDNDDSPKTKISLSGALSVLIEQLQSQIVKGRASVLFDLWFKTLNIQNYGSVIEKCFSTSLESSEIEYMKSYSKSIRKLIQQPQRDLLHRY